MFFSAKQERSLSSKCCYFLTLRQKSCNLLRMMCLPNRRVSASAVRRKVSKYKAYEDYKDAMTTNWNKAECTISYKGFLGYIMRIRDYAWLDKMNIFNSHFCIAVSWHRRVSVTRRLWVMHWLVPGTVFLDDMWKSLHLKHSEILKLGLWIIDAFTSSSSNCGSGFVSEFL